MSLGETWALQKAKLAWHFEGLSLDLRLRGLPLTAPSVTWSKPSTAAAPNAEPVKATISWPAIRLPSLRLPFVSLGTTVKLATGVAAMVAMPFLIVPAIAHFNLGEVRARYTQYRADAEAIQWLDATGERIALRPRGDTGMTVLASESVPDDLFQIYRAWENPLSKKPWRNWYGLDAQSMLVAVSCKLYKNVTKNIRRKKINCRGASTLEMQAARAWSGGYGGKSGGSVTQQAAYALDAMSLSLLYPTDSQEYRKLVMDGLTFGTAPGGTELYGPRLASLVTFGAEPEKLSRAQQAILAAMPLHRIAWSCNPDFVPSKKQREERQRILNRAAEGVEKAFPVDPTTPAVQQEILATKLPLQPAPLPGHLTKGLSSRQACEAAANPQNGPHLVTNIIAAAVRAELANSPVKGDIARLRVTITTDEQLAFARALKPILNDVIGTPAARKFWPPHAKDAPDIVAVTVKDGKITRFYTNSQRNILDEKRSVGSIGKLVILFAAASENYDGDDMLCKARDTRTGLIEPNGFAGYDSCHGAAQIGFSAAFARSANLPLLDLARKLDQDQLRQIAEAAGFEIPDDVDLPYALTTGMAKSTPRKILAFQQVLANAAAGKMAHAPFPYVVDSVVVDGVSIPNSPKLLDLSRFLRSGQASELLAAAGSAAISQKGGTLSAITGTLPAQAGEVAKTGTVAGSRPALNTRIKQAVGASADGRTWFVALGGEKGFAGGKGLSILPLPRFVREQAFAN